MYGFLRQCEASPLPKLVLDSGAGGDEPPLWLFYKQGYKTYGIEIAERKLAEATQFCEENQMQLNILRGDMRSLPFSDQSFSFAYSYNAIFFMTKPDIAVAMHEIERVLRPGGLCYVNFISIDIPDRAPFSEAARCLYRSERFSHHEDDEADAYFGNFEILRKEKRLIEKLHEGEKMRQAYIDYIARRQRSPGG